MLDNGDLVIRDVSWANNMGLYRCVAENDAGSDRVDTFLYPVRRHHIIGSIDNVWQKRQTAARIVRSLLAGAKEGPGLGDGNPQQGAGVELGEGLRQSHQKQKIHAK